ncbi:MAG TPA: DNA replication/repair protein RecF [Hyphomicrobiaceae bacterium]|nr:DNA replication/repair protein RecF [Hyphomicrobiaceae bacterium]
MLQPAADKLQGDQRPRPHRKPRHWIGRLFLSSFRNYVTAEIEAGPEPIVLVGPNGVGKTNLLEAVSLLAPGHGLKHAPYEELARKGGPGDWAVSAVVHGSVGPLQIGTALRRPAGGSERRSGRTVHIDGERRGGPAALADCVHMVWLVPAMDGLFTGPASERRRFLDRLIVSLDRDYAGRLSRFERAMRQRNRLLENGLDERVLLEGLEIQMAETGVAIAASRREAVSALAAAIAERRMRDPASPFPWVGLDLVGSLEAQLTERPAVEVEDGYRHALARSRERDRAAKRALEGPHRSDLHVWHGPKDTPAKLSSTGEQKALLMGLVLAHAELLAERRQRPAPILLLDEVAAHLDARRRAALFADILHLGMQVWMTGTDRRAFEALSGRALFADVDDGRITVGARPL